MTLPRSGPVRSEAARLAILDAAVSLFAERGYDHLTMEGIARRAGVGKQTIYRWWPSKGDVIAEAILEGRLLGGHREIPDSGDARTDLARWLTDLFTLRGSPQGEGLLRSLVAAAAGSAETGRRLRAEILAAPLMDRLSQAMGGASGARLDAAADALLGAVILRALSREDFDGDDMLLLVDAIVGTAPGAAERSTGVG
ncbi:MULTISPECIES: TetR/AcrR family transcriptional regulator [Microbacterium]|uniref:TetR/AcrR family transcriptional regulator n=1 Tax=Microbacterium TaxID=33882 RepID=UPI00278541B5|nr:MULTISPECIES: TetR/AcrR family transcriptional regulator [Microbacterium]MDQ1082984.1 AcrR family transcriptional regulator [Microbacterium sp. SORGH_AS_0344]MDQ1168249.1 AcrR family transcriptional regulator [Microbacterium proteolyticum]